MLGDSRWALAKPGLIYDSKTQHALHVIIGHSKKKDEREVVSVDACKTRRR